MDITIENDNAGTPVPFPFFEQRLVGSWNAKLLGLGGWNLSIHHFLEPVLGKIFFGDGSIRKPVIKVYNSKNYVVSEDGNEIYYFDSNGKHLSTNNAKTDAVLYLFSYDSNGYLSSVVDSYGNTTSFQRNGAGVLTGIQAPYGQITTTTIDTNGNLASVQNPKGETFSMTYTSGNLLHTFQLPKGQMTTFTYDTQGDLVSDVNSAGHSVTLSTSTDTLGREWIHTTNALGQSDRVNTSNYLGGFGRMTERKTGLMEYMDYNKNYVYSGVTNIFSKNVQYTDDIRFGNALKTISSSSYQHLPSLLYTTTHYSQTLTASSTSTPFSYTEIQETAVTGGKTTTQTYNKTTGTTEAISPLNRKTKYTTDIYGKIVSIQNADFFPIQYFYDTNGRLQSITQGTRQSQIQYNSLGEIQSSTNALNQTTSFTYDLAGRVLTKTLPDFRIAGFSYDANGNVTSITTPSSQAHSFTFNPFDLQSHYTAPTIGTTTPVSTQYIYDNAKKLTQITRPDLSTVVYNYDSLSGLITSLNASGDITTFTMKSSGEIGTVVTSDSIDYTQSITDGFLIQAITKNSSALSIGTVDYTYNSDFRVSNMTISTGGSTTSSVNYTYDDDGLLQAAGSLAISLDATTGIPVKKTLNKIQEISSFDSSYGEPVSLLAQYVTGATTTPLFSQTYTRDALGRIQTKSETIATTTNIFSYTYDSAGRLTDVSKNSASYSHYNFDNNNNLTSGTIGGVAFTATYDSQDRITKYKTNTYVHNLNGEMISKKVNGVTTNFTYNGLGLLKTAKYGTSATITYLYDGLNRRIGRMSGSTVQKYWVYQDQLRIGAELNASRAITKKFIYGTKVNVPEYIIIGTTTYKVISDHLGSVRLVVNAANGTIAQAIEYNERGEVISDTNPGFQPFGFAGGLYDTTTKLVHFGARDYDASIGRWISKDPIGFAGGDTNLYGYVLNDPINFIDPTGNNPLLFIGGGALAGAFGGGIGTYAATAGQCSGWDRAGTVGLGIVGGALGGAVAGLTGQVGTILGGIGAIGFDVGATVAFGSFFPGGCSPPKPPSPPPPNPPTPPGSPPGGPGCSQ